MTSAVPTPTDHRPPDRRWRGRGSLGLTLLVSAALLLGTPAASSAVGPAASAAPTPHAVRSDLVSLPITGVDRQAARTAPAPAAALATDADGHGVTAPSPGSRMVALSAEEDTAPFRLVGVTWSGSTPESLAAWVRTRSEGTWSAWHTLEYADDHGPDEGTEEAKTARTGTAPLLVEESDGVQVRLDAAGPAPADLRVDLVDPGASEADAALGSEPTAVTAAAGAPSFFSRRAWGADESLRRDEPSYGSIRAGFIHHTVDANGYSEAEVPGIIRAIYSYHVRGQGWNDIGYNALVDRFGRRWEGRYGGLDKPVIGAQTLNYNTYSFGVAAIGTHTSTPPSAAEQNAFVSIFAWKLSLGRINPLGTASLINASTGQAKTFNTVSGHRDGFATSCPGDAMYAQLPSLRSRMHVAQGAMFYQPTVSATSVAYAAGGSTIRASASGNLAWRLTVATPCAGTVDTVTGTATSSKGLTAAWDGRTSAGGWAPPGAYTLTLTASGTGGEPGSAVPFTTQLTVTGTPGAPPGYCPPRITGPDRYAVSVAAARAANDTTRSVVITSGATAALGDALVSGPLARATSSVLLLTSATALPTSVAAEITRRRAQTAYIVGGPASVSTAVETRLRSLGVTSITRYGGASRFEVAAAVAAAIGPSTDVMVASGRNEAMADGLSLSGPAARLGRPILLVTDREVPEPTRQALTTLGAQRTVVAGGTGSVPDTVLTALPSPTRLGGASRFDVSVSVASWAARNQVPTTELLVASGEQAGLTDSLSGGQLGLVTVYATRTVLPAQVASWLASVSGTPSLRVLGGTATISDTVAGAAQTAARS